MVSYKDLDDLEAVRGVAWALGERLALYAMPKPARTKQKKENHITPQGQFLGELVQGCYECASCKLIADLVDGSFASPQSLELLHGLAGQRGSEAPQEPF